MTNRAFIEVLLHFLADFLRFEVDRFDDLSAVTTIKCDITAFRIEVIFSLFSERGNIDEISIGGRHGFYYIY